MNITNIEEAISICDNSVTLIGALSELNIDVKNLQDDTVIVSYKGVVDCNNAFIKIYGKFSNNSTVFNSAVESLKKLTANICTLSENGDITDVEFSHTASMVYVEGKFTSSSTINADYISSTTKTIDESDLYGDVIGVPLEWDGNDVKMLILTHYYHNILTFNCLTPHEELTMKTVHMEAIHNSYENGQYSPIVMCAVETLDKQIDASVVNQALTEHEIFIASVTNNG